MIVALISPFLLLFGMSFTIETGQDDGWVLSLANYQAFFNKTQYVWVLVRSIGISTLVAIVTVPFSSIF